MVPLDKKQARSCGLQARASMSSLSRMHKSEEVCKQVLAKIHAGMKIGCYVSINDELDTTMILQYCFHQKIDVFVPKVEGNTLGFYQIQSFDDLHPASFNLLEPNTDIIIQVEEIDMMIVPLSSYDEYNHRTGYGKGYYDSVLGKCKYKVGVAFQCQRVLSIDIEEHDITLDEIISA